MEELEVNVVDVHNDEILDAAIVYKTDGTYPTEASKDKKRAIRKRSERLEVDKGELFLLRKNGRVKIIIDPAEQKRILEACHSDITSGHFGVTKTCKRLTERFYWRGITQQAKDLVSCIYVPVYLSTEHASAASSYH